MEALISGHHTAERESGDLTVMYNHHLGGWGWDYVLMFIGMGLFWSLLIVGIFLLVRYAGHGSAEPPNTLLQRPSAEKLLAERFARGEIDEDEYRNRLTVLRTSSSS